MTYGAITPKKQFMKIRFLSKNPHKITEATTILGPAGVEIIPVNLAIDELQSNDTERIVRDKALRAFEKLGHPLFIEQTGLYLSRLHGFPGGLTQVFWDTIKADRMCEVFGSGTDTGVVARTRIGYCDGRRIHQFEGEIAGNIAPQPRGDRAFQWDCVFIPEGSDQTFAEMGERKNEISMRRRALDAFARYLKEASDV